VHQYAAYLWVIVYHRTISAKPCNRREGGEHKRGLLLTELQQVIAHAHFCEGQGEGDGLLQPTEELGGGGEGGEGCGGVVA